MRCAFGKQNPWPTFNLQKDWKSVLGLQVEVIAFVIEDDHTCTQYWTLAPLPMELFLISNSGLQADHWPIAVQRLGVGIFDRLLANVSVWHTFGIALTLDQFDDAFKLGILAPLRICSRSFRWNWMICMHTLISNFVPVTIVFQQLVCYYQQWGFLDGTRLKHCGFLEHQGKDRCVFLLGVCIYCQLSVIKTRWF